VTYVDVSEPALRAAVSLEEPRALIHRFSTLVRESGSDDERTAAQEIAERLRSWGVPHTVYEPLLYLSVPQRASLDVLSPKRVTLRAKTPAFSRATNGEAVRGRVVYVPTASGAPLTDSFDAALPANVGPIAGRIVLTEGFPSPQKVLALQQQGATAIIFIHPGQAIHEMICTTVWGAPDLDALPRKPIVAVVSVNRLDGDSLVAMAREGLEVAVHTQLHEGWMRCPVVVAEIRGTESPDEFVLAHGHVDSWHVGIGDNATGNAALLELARIFWAHRSQLRRTLRIAWWAGHSTGRYAGSTWYADTFALDLVERCVAHMNIDSPGCRWATEYEDISWMPETVAFSQQAIRDATGQPSSGERPHRAGDWSFNNLGISGFFMLFSTMPKALLTAKGYYPVGGCGANIAWHTEDDTLEIFDEANLLRDLKAYVTAVVRALNAPVHPLDFRATTREFAQTVAQYQQIAGEQFDLAPVAEELASLDRALDRFAGHCSELRADPVADRRVRAANAALRRIARELVLVNFGRADRFHHDPAMPIPPLPDLAAVRQLASGDPAYRGFVQAHLLRGRNRVIWALREARRIAETAV
jgi:hypothetical protein